MRRCVPLMLLVTLIVVLGVPIQPALARPAAAPGVSAFGVNSHSASRYPDPGSLAVPTTVLAQASSGWAREDFQFSRIAPARGQYDWSFFDQAVNELSARGINIIGVLNGPSPAWATPGGQGGFYPPDPQLFAEFARAVVTRYKDRVRYWEVWNEPDNQLYWQSGPNAVEYANLLKAASPAIKAADPNAQVLVAGIVSPEPAVSFLTTIANNGGWGTFDIISLHPYTDPKGPEEGQIGAAGIGAVQALAERLGRKPIWATEFGWSTGRGGRGGVAFDAETQANYLVRGMALTRAAGAERVLWYNLKDTASDEQYGLLSLGGGPTDYAAAKPSLNAFRVLNEQIANGRPVGLLDLGGQQTVLGFEENISWRTGDQPNGTLQRTTAQRRTGNASAQVNYSFPGGSNDFVVLLPSSPIALPGNPSQLGMWLFGDGSGHELKVWLRDAEGEELQFRLGVVGGAGWQLLSTPINGPVEEFNVISNRRNLRVDFPARITAVVVDDSPDSFAGSGTFFIDDVVAVGGPEAYGVRFARGGEVVDVIWSPVGGPVSVATGSGQGTLVDRNGGQLAVNASNGQFSINAGPSPVYLRHTPGAARPPAPAPAPAPQPGPGASGQRCFEQTGFCISGRIREYWEQNGGLPVFGYPIGPQGEQVIEGQRLQAQWFERNRLELHPENQRPYDVLLGRLGADRLAQQNRDWQQFPCSSAQANCRFFPETGHNVCGELLAAWRANGLEIDGRPGKTEGESLALWGLPLSEPQVETLSDGRQYTVQWFERARFELHPENRPPFNVLFGLLGNEIQGRR